MPQLPHTYAHPTAPFPEGDILTRPAPGRHDLGGKAAAPVGHDARVEHIVLLDRAALRADIRRPAFPHTWTEYDATPRDEIVERLQGATIAIINRAPLRRDMLHDPALADLRLIAVAATGVNTVDLAAAGERGIWVTNIRGWCDRAVAEHVISLVLALRRELVPYSTISRDGTWGQAAHSVVREPLPLEVRGQTMGIVGFGSTGQAVAGLAAAVGMHTAVAARRGEPAGPGRMPFEETLKASDVLTLHCPLTDETRNLVGAPELALLPPGALLVNCSRGGVVDEEALAAALRDGHLAGAALDVLAEEPPRHGSPLFELPNVIVTPHVAWASRQSVATLVEQLIANIEAFVAGDPRNVVVRATP
jgi:glycerate dehydrogenase